MRIKPTGIKRNTSLLHNQDGACAELINFRFKNEQWESIQPGTLLKDFSGLTGIASTDIFYKHQVLADNLLIWWKSTTGDIFLIDTTTGLESGAAIITIPGVTKISAFGIILLIVTATDIYYLKYDQDIAAYVQLKPIEHGRYSFDDVNREQFGSSYGIISSDWLAEGISKVFERKHGLEQAGKMNGHVFFRMAFKTIDGNFINYSPIYYRNIGYSTETDGTTTTGAETVPNVREEVVGGVTTYRFSWGNWANARFKFQFTTEQLKTISAYNGLIDSLCIFMTSPHLDWDYTADKGALIPYNRVSGTDTYTYYFYPHTSGITDFFKDTNSFFLVKEISLLGLVNFYLGGTVGGTFTSVYSTAVALPSPPATLTNVFITKISALGSFTYVEGTNYTIDYLGKTITVLPGGSVVGESIYMTSTVIKYSLSEKLLYTFKAYNGTTIYPDTDFEVDYPNGTVKLLNSDLLHTTVYFDFDYGMENSTVYDASYGTPLNETLEVGDLSTLDTNKSLPIDNFTAHKYFSSILYDYNSRLHIGDVKTLLGRVPNLTIYDTNDQGHLPSGFTAVQDANNQTWSFWAVVTLQTDNGEKTVLTNLDNIAVFNNTTDYSCLGQILMYPDQRASSMVIYGNDGAYKSVMLTIPLTSHTYGNYSYYINPSGLADTPVLYGSSPSTVSTRVLKYSMLSLTLGDVVPTPTNKNIVEDTNRVQTSEVNNILLYPAANSYRIGSLSGTVVGIQSQAVAVSIGQYGQYPVYVFTNEGIWALQQGSTVLYQSIQPVSLLEANNTKSVIGIEGGILFATAKGLFILSGSEIKEISIPVRGTPETFINSLPSFTTTQTNLPANISTIDFVKWMEGAIFGYDKVNKEIIISKDDTYIFSLESGMWYKEASVYSDFLRIGGKFYGMIGNTLYDRETPDDTSDVTAYVITRPVKFASDGLKSIAKTVLRLIADMNTKEVNKLSYHVYGSLNGFEWRLIQGKDYTDFINSSGVPGKEISLEFTRTTARYFIFVLALKSKVIRLEGFDMDVEPKYNDKER